MRSYFLQNAFSVIGAIALVSIYSMLWGQMINNPAGRNSTDFMAFYAAGRVAQSHGYPDIYNIQLQQKEQEAVVGYPLREGQVLLYNHLPYLAPILTLVVNREYINSFIRWGILLIITYLVAAVYLTNSLATDKDFKFRSVFAIGIATFFPMFVSIWQGQDTAFLFLGVTLWCIGMLKKQDTHTAIGLALVTIRPHIFIMLALPLLFNHRRTWRPFIIAIGALVLFSVAILTPAGVLGFINLLRISAQGEWFGIRPEAMMNLLGLTIRSIPTLNSSAINIISWIIYGIGLISIVVLWIRSKDIDGRLLGMTILIAIITAPHLHLHDLTLLIFPILFIDSRRIKISQPALLLIGISFIFIAGMVTGTLYYVLPYGMYICLAWLLLNRDHDSSQPKLLVLNDFEK